MGGKLITLRYAATCRDCGAELPVGASARWYGRGAIYGRGCHDADGGGPCEDWPCCGHQAGDCGAARRSARVPARRVLDGEVLSKLEGALEAADEAATRAAADYRQRYYQRPAFAVVENARGDFASDASKPERVVGLMADVCGFVWLEVSNKRGAKLIADWKSAGKLTKASGKAHYARKVWSIGRFELHYSASHSKWSSAWSLSVPSVGYGNGSMSAMEAAGRAFAESMAASGYDGIDMESRID